MNISPSISPTLQVGEGIRYSRTAPEYSELNASLTSFIGTDGALHLIRSCHNEGLQMQSPHYLGGGGFKNVFKVKQVWPTKQDWVVLKPHELGEEIYEVLKHVPDLPGRPHRCLFFKGQQPRYRFYMPQAIGDLHCVEFSSESTWRKARLMRSALRDLVTVHTVGAHLDLCADNMLLMENGQGEREAVISDFDLFIYQGRVIQPELGLYERLQIPEEQSSDTEEEAFEVTEVHLQRGRREDILMMARALFDLVLVGASWAKYYSYTGNQFREKLFWQEVDHLGLPIGLTQEVLKILNPILVSRGEVSPTAEELLTQWDAMLDLTRPRGEDGNTRSAKRAR